MPDDIHNLHFLSRKSVRGAAIQDQGVVWEDAPHRDAAPHQRATSSTMREPCDIREVPGASPGLTSRGSVRPP